MLERSVPFEQQRKTVRELAVFRDLWRGSGWRTEVVNQCLEFGGHYLQPIIAPSLHSSIHPQSRKGDKSCEDGVWLPIWRGSEPVWPTGEAVGWYRGASVRIRFCSPFSSKVVICGHCLVTLSLTIMKH